MTTLTRYLVPCLTESENVPTDYMDHVPTKCPNNIDHIIDTTNIFAEHTIETKTVRVDDGCEIETGGYFRVDQHEIIVAPSTVSTYDVIYNYNVGVYAVTFLPGAENIGDNFYIIGVPNSPIGTLTTTLATGANILQLTAYNGFNTSMLNPGFVLNLYDGVNTIDLGHIISVTGSNITFSDSTIQEVNAGVQVRMGVPRVSGGKFITTDPMPLGLSKIGSSSLPAGKCFRVYYTNNTNQAKTIHFLTEIEF